MTTVTFEELSPSKFILKQLRGKVDSMSLEEGPLRSGTFTMVPKPKPSAHHDLRRKRPPTVPHSSHEGSDGRPPLGSSSGIHRSPKHSSPFYRLDHSMPTKAVRRCFGADSPFPSAPAAACTAAPQAAAGSLEARSSLEEAWKLCDPFSCFQDLRSVPQQDRSSTAAQKQPAGAARPSAISAGFDGLASPQRRQPLASLPPLPPTFPLKARQPSSSHDFRESFEDAGSFPGFDTPRARAESLLPEDPFQSFCRASSRAASADSEAGHFPGFEAALAHGVLRLVETGPVSCPASDPFANFCTAGGSGSSTPRSVLGHASESDDSDLSSEEDFEVQHWMCKPEQQTLARGCSLFN